MTGVHNDEKPVNPLLLHIDCTQGISARSFLHGLRVLAQTSGDTHSRDAFQMDPMTAAIWMDHIPDNDRVILQDGSRSNNVNPETPVQSWEPFRKAIRDSPVEVSEKVVCQLKELVDAIELYYDDEVKSISPLYPSVVWHMMAVVLLLDRLRIQSMTSSAVPKSSSPTPKVLAEILKDFAALPNTDENPATTTFDGAILLKVLKPKSPFSPDRVFHGKATGRDVQIQTVLGLTFDQQVTTPPPPEMAPPKTRAVAPPPPPTMQQATPVQQQPPPVAAVAPPPPLQEPKKKGGLESPLWNVEKTLTLLQTNIDDMTAEHLAFCTELLMHQGAADVWLTPIIMKKGRAAHELNCLAKEELIEGLLITIFRQTTTLGVRVWSSSAGLQRVSLRREIVTVHYCRRHVQVKVAYLGNEPVSLKPEYEQCAALSEQTQIPLVVVTEEVKAMAKDITRRKLLAQARG